MITKTGPARVLGAVVILLNATAIVMLALKLIYGVITNDDLIAVMAAVFLANFGLAIFRKRARNRAG